MVPLNRRAWLPVPIALLLAACGGSKPAEPAKEFALQGTVMRMDPQVRTAVIKHGNIEGWMEAMTMEFPIRDAREFEKLSVGKRITATVFVAGDEYWLGRIGDAPATPPDAAEPKPEPKAR